MNIPFVRKSQKLIKYPVRFQKGYDFFDGINLLDNQNNQIVEHQVEPLAKGVEVVLFSASDYLATKQQLSKIPGKFSSVLSTAFLPQENVETPVLHEEAYESTYEATDFLSPEPITPIVQPPQPIYTPRKSNRNKYLNFVLSLISIVSFVIALAIFVPAAYFFAFPADVVEMVPREQGTVYGGDFAPNPVATAPAATPEPYVPDQDLSLPIGDWLVIPRIGVRTPLRKTEDPEVALAEGVWHVPEFGDPGDRNQPMILAAHRFGWKWWWKDEYWKYNSFNQLPETEPGDRIEIISDQRKWIYEIYAGEEGEQITDYAADLILYTCKYLDSPIRHFRYARIIDPTLNTQQ
jgi:hypothetical protein